MRYFSNWRFTWSRPSWSNLVCTVASGAVLARVSGEQWMLPVSLKHTFWREPANIWPILCLWAGVASATLFDQLALGLACLAVAYGAHAMMVQLWLRWQKLNRYALPHSDLRTHILDLARNAGVVINDIYLLPVAEGRLSGPYMIRRQRLMLSDALLRTLPKNETEAVLARELCLFAAIIALACWDALSYRCLSSTASRI